MTTTHARDTLSTLRHDFSAAVLEGLSEQELRARLDLATQLEGIVTVGLSRTVQLLAEAGAPRKDGVATARGWVQQQTGRSTAEAARLVRLGRGLDTLPTVAAKVEAGQVRPESADVLLRAVDDGRLGDAAEVDAAFATAASLPADALRGLVRQRTAARDGAAMRRDEQRQHAARRLTLSSGADGMTRVHGQLAPEAGERFRVALDALNLPDPADTPDELRRDPGQRMADALDELSRRALAVGELPQTGGLLPQLTVHCDLATLAATFDGADPDDDPATQGAPAEPPRWDDPRWAGAPAGQTSFGTDLSPQAIRRIACDSAMVRVVTASTSQPLDVGRATRVWTNAQRRAVHDRDRGCRGPGCDRPAPWTQIHHVQWWRHGGATNLDNALALCTACHTLVHDHGWDPRIEPSGDVVWSGPDGRHVIARTRPRPW